MIDTANAENEVTFDSNFLRLWKRRGVGEDAKLVEQIQEYDHEIRPSVFAPCLKVA